MRFLGIIITLAIIAYVIHISSGSSGHVETTPEQSIDQTKQATDAMNRAVQSQQEKLDNTN